MAPTPQDFYTFLNKGKPVGVTKSGDDLGDLLNAADEDLVFKPDEVKFQSSRIDNNFDFDISVSS